MNGYQMVSVGGVIWNNTGKMARLFTLTVDGIWPTNCRIRPWAMRHADQLKSLQASSCALLLPIYIIKMVKQTLFRRLVK